MISLLYKALPIRMLIEMVKFVILWLNDFTNKRGGSGTIITRGIITGMALRFRQHRKVKFGAYFQMHKEKAPTNTIIVCTRRIICLGPSNNN